MYQNNLERLPFQLAISSPSNNSASVHVLCATFGLFYAVNIAAIMAQVVIAQLIILRIE